MIFVTCFQVLWGQLTLWANAKESTLSLIQLWNISIQGLPMNLPPFISVQVFFQNYFTPISNSIVIFYKYFHFLQKMFLSFTCFTQTNKEPCLFLSWSSQKGTRISHKMHTLFLLFFSLCIFSHTISSEERSRHARCNKDRESDRVCVRINNEPLLNWNCWAS